MASVYSAQDTRLDRTVALKVLPPEFLYDGSFALRFEQEARLIARLEHPNIVPIYASGIDKGIPWMSMRLFAGGHLGGLLSDSRLEPIDVVRMLRSIAEGLDYAHARGVVHRDLKPTNILLDGSGTAFLGDFGLAQLLEGDGGVTRTGTLVGTPQYMAPEQALGEPVDRRCDIYSLGIVAYEMLVGATPFSGDSPMAVMLKQVSEPLPIPPDNRVPRSVMEAIQRAVEKSPADRWASAGAFVSALDVAVGLEPAHGVPPGRDTPGRTTSHSPRWWGAAAGVAAVGLTWWIARAPQPRDQPSPLSAVERPEPAVQEADDRLLTETGESALPTDPAAGVPPVPRAGPAAVASPRPNTATTPPISPNPAAPLPPPPLPARPIVVSAQPPLAVPTPIQRLDPAEVTALAPDVRPNPAPAVDIRTPPVLLRSVRPDYPAAARAAQMEGDVILQATVGTDGKVQEVTVLQSVHPLIDEAATNAVLTYEYEPGELNGVPEIATSRVTVSFRLGE
jgi:serine/threonine-protein kinase